MVISNVGLRNASHWLNWMFTQGSGNEWQFSSATWQSIGKTGDTVRLYPVFRQPQVLYLYWPVKFQTMQMAPGQKNKRIRPSKNTRLQPLGESFGPWQLLWAEGSKMIFLWRTASGLGGAVLIGSMPSIRCYPSLWGIFKDSKRHFPV